MYGYIAGYADTIVSRALVRNQSVGLYMAIVMGVKQHAVPGASAV